MRTKSVWFENFCDSIQLLWAGVVCCRKLKVVKKIHPSCHHHSFVYQGTNFSESISHPRGLYSNPGHTMCNLLWEEWRWDRSCLSPSTSGSPSVSYHQCSILIWSPVRDAKIMELWNTGHLKIKLLITHGNTFFLVWMSCLWHCTFHYACTTN
jgi:hypothetical protein